MTEDDFAVVTKYAWTGFYVGSTIIWGAFTGITKEYNSETGILTITASFLTNNGGGNTQYEADVYC